MGNSCNFGRWGLVAVAWRNELACMNDYYAKWKTGKIDVGYGEKDVFIT